MMERASELPHLPLPGLSQGDCNAILITDVVGTELVALVRARHIMHAMCFRKDNFAICAPNSQARAMRIAVDGERDCRRNLSDLCRFTTHCTLRNVSAKSWLSGSRNLVYVETRVF